MSTPIIAASAAAFGLYVYLKQRQQSATAEGSALRTSPVTAEAWRHVEHPPNTWTEALYYVKEVCRYMYTETLGRWHTVDLFVGLAYLSHREPLEYPAMDIAYRGRLLSQDQSLEATQALLVELKEVQRHLLYCRGLKYFKEDQQIRFWVEHLQLDPAQVLSQSAKAKVLRPAYVLLADTELRCIVLCIRGTQNYQDLFTSLAATSKPHHKVSANGVVLGFSHLGMLTAARWLLRELARDICLAMKMHPGYKLRVVGHSMGAGTAALLTTMLREGIPECADAKCYALACPACMTLELAQSCKDYVTSIVHGTDIVPTFSAASVDALREDVMHSSWFVEFQRDLRTSLYRTVQDGWRGMGSATQWTARNILQPPFRSCYPQGQTAGNLSTPGMVLPSAHNPSLAADILASAAAAEAVSNSGSDQDLSASGILRHHSHNADWPQARQTRRSSGSGALAGSGDTWLPANHMGGALSTQQLRRRLWPWGTGRERDGGSGDSDNIGVGYEAAASMSYAGWLPDSEHYNPSVGAVEHGAQGEQAAGRSHQQRASSDGGGGGGAVRSTGVVGVTGANGQYFDAYEESPSKRKSWSALQGLSKWWQQRLSTAGGGGATAAASAGVRPGGEARSKPGAEGLAQRPVEALSSVGVGVPETGSEQVPRAAGAGLASAGPALPTAPPGGSSAAWLLRGMFNVCTTRRAHAQHRPLATADSARLDELDGEQTLGYAGPSLTMGPGSQDIGVSEGLGGEPGTEDEMPGAGDEFEAREVQEDITAVVAAMAGEGPDAEGLRESREEDEEDGDLAASLTAEEQEALLRELSEGATSPSTAGLLPMSPVRVGSGRPSLPSGNGPARKAQRLSGPGGPGQRGAAAGAQEDSSSTAGRQGQAAEHAAAGSRHEAELQHDGFGLAAPKRHMYPPGRILHLLPAARISGPTGPLPSSCPAPRSQLGAPPLGGVSAAMLAESISRNTPTPSGIRPGTAEITSSRVAFYESPHVMLEVPDNQAYSRIKLCRTMVLDHLMPAYLTALGSVVQQLEAQVQQHAAPSMPVPAAPLLAGAEQLVTGASARASTSGSASALLQELSGSDAPLRGPADSRAMPDQPSSSQASIAAPSLPLLAPPLPPASRAYTAADKKELSQAVQEVAAARRQASAPAVAEPVLLGPSLSAGTVHLRNTARQRPIFSADGDLL